MRNISKKPPPVVPEREKTPLEIAKFHLNEWLAAELKVTNSQAYTIGSRSLSMANLAEIRKTIDYWKNQVAELENAEKRNGRNRVVRVVPRDL